MAVTSDELNFLVYRYLQESGQSLCADTCSAEVRHVRGVIVVL